MSSRYLVASLCAVISISSSALAAPKFAVYPVQVGPETVRYMQGTPTLDLQLVHGAAQITPLLLDHGSLSFSIAIWNAGQAPVNFGIENISATSDALSLSVFSKDQLVAKAENRAMWTQIGLAALGGLAAVSAANSQRYVTTTTRVPGGGLYTSRTTYHDSSDELRAAALLAGTGVGIAAVQRRLDETRAALGNDIVQTTTIDPFDSYAGRIVLEKIKTLKLPQDVRIGLVLNGETYPFTVRIQKFGSVPPLFTAITPAAQPAKVGASEQTLPPAPDGGRQDASTLPPAPAAAPSPGP